MFENTGVHYKREELILLSQKLVQSEEGKKSIQASQITKFCATEADRQEWTLVSGRIRNASQNAYINGVDVEQLLSEKDKDGSHFISFTSFKEFLVELSKYGKLSHKEINLCCRHFSNTSSQGIDDSKGPISLNAVMSFIGKEYTGNIQIRIQKIICKENISAQLLLKKINSLLNESKPRNNYSFDDIELFFKKEGVFDELSHEQVRSVLTRLDIKDIGRVSASQLLKYLGVPFKASDLSIEAPLDRLDSSQDISVEYLLRVLLEKVQNNGIAVDEAFRHFDTNGDGFISTAELLEGLDKLRIFDHIPNYKREIPNLVKKFDTSGDGLVSLKEFFNFLGIKDYSPNIVQKMTKIFAVATQKGISFKDIFQELDEDGNGTLDKDEIIAGLNKLGTFGEVTIEDAASVIALFDKDNDQTVSIDEFVKYFSAKVDRVLKERRRVQGEKIAKRFKEVMVAAKSKGAMAKDIFGHFDKDKGGTVTSDELARGLRSLPNFKALSDQDIQDLVEILDTDNSGSVSLAEFESFLEDPTGPTEQNDSDTDTIIGKVKAIFNKAKESGLSFEKTFQLIDQDGNGELTKKELATCLKKLPSFNNVSEAEINELFDNIDTDGSGSITTEEFKRYVLGEQLPQRDSRHESKSSSDNNRKDKRMIKLSGDHKEMFIRLMKRISEVDGSVSALLAFLDDDEDGFISISSLKNILRREDMFQYIPEDVVDQLLLPLADNGKLEVVDLIKFIDGDNASPYVKRTNSINEPLNNVFKQYNFSNDPEIHSVERKLRKFGSILAKKGIDVESYFREFDRNNNGTVRRTEFIEILSKIGMYLLEQGKVLEQFSNSEHDIRRQQINIIKKMRCSSSTYADNAPRMARRLLMNTDDHRSIGDFKV